MEKSKKLLLLKLLRQHIADKNRLKQAKNIDMAVNTLKLTNKYPQLQENDAYMGILDNVSQMVDILQKILIAAQNMESKYTKPILSAIQQDIKSYMG